MKWMPTGRLSALRSHGTDMAGTPAMLARDVNGMKLKTAVR